MEARHRIDCNISKLGKAIRDLVRIVKEGTGIGLCPSNSNTDGGFTFSQAWKLVTITLTEAPMVSKASCSKCSTPPRREYRCI